MRSPEQIFALYLERAKQYSGMHQGMQKVKDIYEGKAKVPMPDMAEDAESSVPNLLAQGVDQMAGRIASTTPIPAFSAGDTRRSQRKAKTAERVISGWWQNDRLSQKMKHRARHLIAYGMSPTVIRLDPRSKLPVWQVRNPLHTFPSMDCQPGTAYPNDVIFAYRRSVNWLFAQGYDLQVRSLFPGQQQIPRDLQLLMIEYVDADGTHLCLSSYSASSTSIGQWDNAGNYVMTGMNLIQAWDKLSRQYPIGLIDCGNQMRDDLTAAILSRVDAVVVVSTTRYDGAAGAQDTLNWLISHGYPHLVRSAVMLISNVNKVSADRAVRNLHEDFERVCRAVHDIPYDPHLSDATAINFDRLAPATRRAYLEAAASVVDGFAGAADKDSGYRSGSNRNNQRGDWR